MASAELKATDRVNATNKEIAAGTNQANKDIAQMNNEFNLAMLEKQIAYNKEAYEKQFSDQTNFAWDMWNATNEYNSPTAKMERLKEAGINPYTAVGENFSGTASSVGGSSASMNGVTPPTASPYEAVGYQAIKPDIAGSINATAGILGTINNAVKTMNDTMKSQAEISLTKNMAMSKSIQNAHDLRTLGARIGGTIAGEYGKGLQNQYQQTMNAFTPALMQNQVTASELANQGQAIQNAMSDINLQYLPIEKRLQVGTYVADISNKVLQGRLTEKQINTEINKALDLIAGKELKESQKDLVDAQKSNVESNTEQNEFYNKQRERLKEYFDNQIKYQTERMRKNQGTENVWQGVQNFHREISPLFPFPSIW